MALWEIRKFSKSTGLPDQKTTICEVGEGDCPGTEECNLPFKASALLALQEAAEAYVLNLFEDANLCAQSMQRGQH